MENSKEAGEQAVVPSGMILDGEQQLSIQPLCCALIFVDGGKNTCNLLLIFLL